MAAYGQPSRLGPGHQLAVRTLAALGGEGRGNVRQRPDVRGQLAQAGRPGLGRRGGFGADPCGRLEGLIEVAAGWASGFSARRRSRRQPRGSGRSRHRSPPAQPRPGAAGRSSGGRRWTARAGGRRDCRCPPTRRTPARAGADRGVVPVVQVPAEAFEAADGRESRLQPLHHLDRPDPTEVASRHGRQQVHPDVRRRGAMRDGRRWDRPGSCRAAAQWSSGPTKVSKNRQVRRAVSRSAPTSAAESCSAANSGVAG